MSYRQTGHLGQNGNGTIQFEVVVGAERENFPTLAAALDAATISARRSAQATTIVSPPGSSNVMVQVGTSGRARMLFAERQDEYDQTIQALDQTAQEIGAQVQRAAEAAAPVIESTVIDIETQARRTPLPILAIGAGGLLGALLTRGNMLGILGGAAAGYFVDKAVRQ